MLPPLEETFKKSDKMPFGTYVMHDQLEHLYPHNTIFVKKQNFEKTWSEISDTGALYITVTDNLYLSSLDLRAMLQYVSAGNSMFISGNHLENLLDTLNCTAVTTPEIIFSMPELMKYTHVSLRQDLYNDTLNYSYYYYILNNNFTRYDTLNTKVLGFNELGRPNFIVLFYGEGRFFLHLEPKAFSNYFLLQKNNYKYLEKVLAFTNSTPEQIFWDDYYCRKDYESDDDDENSKGSFDFLLKHPPLRWAFWLTLLLLFIYIFFGGKRRQRIIKVAEPNKNTSVAFTETVGRLYLQQRNNRNIADKMVSYFFDHLRTQYFLNTSQLNDEFIITLSRKSNMPLEKVEKLVTTIKYVQNNYDVSDILLLSLSQQIENFNKTK
ncbi:MAG: DUF4350 domain-containing protein [Bacteroidota bacterium]